MGALCVQMRRLDLCPSRLGILPSPGTSGFCIKRPLRDQIVEGATIILQIENAIARIEIKICPVQLPAMRQASGKVSLRCFCLPNPSLENINPLGSCASWSRSIMPNSFRAFRAAICSGSSMGNMGS